MQDKKKNRDYILVSGGTSEIGEKIIENLISKYKIIFSYNKSFKKAVLIEKKFNKQNTILKYKIDLNDLSSIKKFSNFIVLRKIKIINFLHVANIHFDRGEFCNIKKKIFSEVIFGNCVGTFYLTQKVCQNMKKNKKKKNILFFSSQSAEYGGNKLSPYAASKGFINSLCRSLAKELGFYNINVNNLVLGKINTSSFQKNFKNQSNAKVISDIPLRRLGNFDDIANVVKFIISVENSYISGAKIEITGGR
jgi:3-oxoacyl-[acyl-carrier protein] reductase